MREIASITLTTFLTLAVPTYPLGPVSFRTKSVSVTHIAPIGQHECAHPCDRVAVIFVHGITGDADTWSTRIVRSKRNWPDMLASDPDIGWRLDVHRVEYHSRFNDGASASTIGEELSKKLDELLFERNQYKKIVLVCHSLGGILCRGHLLHVKLRWGHVHLSLFKIVYTLGTPTEGAALAELVRSSGNEQVRVLLPSQKNDFLQILTHSTKAYQLKSKICPQTRFFAGYETKRTGPYFIVSKESAIAHSTENFSINGKNHSEIAKPRHRYDEPYPTIKAGIQDCLSGGCGEHTNNPTCSAPELPYWLM